MFPNYGTLVTSDWKYDGKECDSNNSRKGIIVRYLSDTTEADNLQRVEWMSPNQKQDLLQ